MKKTIQTAKYIAENAIAIEKRLTDTEKALVLASIALGITACVAIKNSVENAKLKKRLKRCEKKVERLEDRDFT